MRMSDVIRSQGGDKSQRKLNDVRSRTGQGYEVARVLEGINERGECFVVITRGIRELPQFGQELSAELSIVRL